jgi:RimJ/RimL family protein N-acetyltransferase
MTVIRKLVPYEYDLYRAHLMSLDLASRRLRFAYPISDTSITELCNRIARNPDNHTIFVAENANLEVIGAGHISFDDDKMELAFSVLEGYQGQGVGTQLMKRCIEHCRNRGVTKGYMVCLSHNQKIKHLCAKNGIKMRTEYGETVADIELEPGNAVSVMHEAYVSQLAAFEHFSNMGKQIANLSVFALTLPK